MPRNWKNRGEEESFNYWPAFADMAAATCMMLVIFWIAGVLELGGSKEEVAKLNAEIARLKDLVGKESELEARIRALEQELTTQYDENSRLLKALDESERKRKEAENALAELRDKVPHDEPPNIVLAQDDVQKRFLFPSLQAKVPPEFEKLFKEEKRNEVIAALNSDSNVEVIEIIGHTDNKQVGGSSNVDTNLEAVYAGTKPIGSLAFGSNCELGLARAIAVKSMLHGFLSSLEVGDEGLTKKGRDRINKLTYRTYSAAQLFPTDPMNPGRDEDRRIEIRFTRLRKTTGDQAPAPGNAE